jgi:deoxyribonuclease-4
MERLYNLLIAGGALTSSLTEEQINQRITAWFAGKKLLANV